MDEFLFGALSTDELKLISHRVRRSGIHHSYDHAPRDPRPGDAVTIRVRTGPDLSATHVACYYTTDGSQPSGSRGVARQGHAIHLTAQETVWDTLVWGYMTIWQGQIPAQPEGFTIRYQIGAWQDNGEETFGGYPNASETISAATRAYFAKEPLPQDQIFGDPAAADTYSYHMDTFSPPEWARRAVIYHIFVDRFYPGDGKKWRQTKNLVKICGGTLWGVRDKLDYIAELGADCIWLSPTWASDTHHGYDVIDYDRVEPRLGGDEALRAVIEGAHERGIRVLLDLVCNHVSNKNPIFLEARANPESSHRSWFTFDDSPLGYATYYGVATMPKVNLSNPGARQWMIDVARYWLREYGVDGYRLDHVIGVPTDFWTDFWVACKQEKPDCFCFGEATVTPDELAQYTGRMDGCLDFPVAAALRKTYGWGGSSQADLSRFLEQHYAYFNGDFLLPTFLDNHDMDRFLFVAGGDKNALRHAFSAQMELPHTPVIYYGTEVGLAQKVSVKKRGLDAGRVPMVWGSDQDKDLLLHVQDLIRRRKQR